MSHDTTGSAADRISQRVSAFYERHPYPPPVDSLERHRERWNDDRRRADARLFWPDEPYRDDRSILVAGCGTSQAAKYAVAWPRAKVTGIDVSISGIEHTEKLKQKYQLDNLDVRQLPVERAAELGRGFEHVVCTGVLHHLPAICAITAPSPVSYLRLTPNRWAPTWAYLAERDREACLRVCPVLDLPGFDPTRQFNIEFRPADATASPYLALGVIVWAGVDGIAKGLGLPPPRNVAAMPAEERRAAGIAELPQSLGEALDLLKATAEAKDWFGPTYLDAYLRHKRAEIAMVADLTEEEKCARYAESY